MDNGELTESPQETLERAPYRAYWACVAELVAAKRRITALEARERRVRELVEPHWDAVADIDPLDTTNAQAAKAGLAFQILAILNEGAAE